MTKSSSEKNEGVIAKSPPQTSLPRADDKLPQGSSVVNAAGDEKLQNHAFACATNHGNALNNRIPAIRRVVTCQDVWHHCGLPCEPPKNGTRIHSPFRKDDNPSFSISMGKDGASQF